MSDRDDVTARHPDLLAMEFGGRRVEYYTAGAGPALVMIHGGQCSADDWFNLISHLAPHFRLILPDGLVHAHDPWLLWLLLDRLGVTSAALLGHSAGGDVIRRMYCLQPRRVWAFVSLDSCAAVQPGSTILARRMPNTRFSEEAAAMYEKRRAEMEGLKPHHQGDYPSAVTLACRLRGYRRAAMTPEQIVEAENRPAPVQVHRETNAPPAPRPIPDGGRFITCPTLIYQTGRGKMARDDISPEWIKENVQAADTEYVVIKEAGHWPWLESPQSILRTLVPFLERCAAGN